MQALKSLPQAIEETLQLNESIQSLAKKYAHFENCLFLGRQLMFPIALEGALKLKESHIYTLRAIPRQR